MTEVLARPGTDLLNISCAHSGMNSLVNLEEEDEQDETDDVAAIEDLQEG